MEACYIVKFKNCLNKSQVSFNIKEGDGIKGLSWNIFKSLFLRDHHLTAFCFTILVKCTGTDQN